MSDCRHGGRDAYGVMRLQADFEGQEIPWTYPLALNGLMEARRDAIEAKGEAE